MFYILNIHFKVRERHSVKPLTFSVHLSGYGTSSIHPLGHINNDFKAVNYNFHLDLFSS